MQVLQEQEPAPKAAGAGIFPVRSPCDGLIERLHEPGEAAEPHAASDESVRVAKKSLFLGPAASLIGLTVNGGWKQADPAHRDFFVCPCSGGDRIDPQDDVYMVAHHRIGIHADGKDISQFQQALLDPLPPVFVGRSVIGIGDNWDTHNLSRDHLTAATGIVSC